MLTPGPLIDTKILMLTPGPLVQISFFKSKGRCRRRRRRNHEQKVNKVFFKQSNRCSYALKCQKWAIKKIDRKFLMLTPGPPFSSQVFKFFKSKGRRRRNNEDVRIYFKQSNRRSYALI